MAYGQKINTSSISLQGEFPTIDDPISVATMTSIYRQAQNSTCYNSTKCLSNAYGEVFYEFCLPPVLIFDNTGTGGGSQPKSRSIAQSSGISVFIPCSYSSGMQGMQVTTTGEYIRPYYESNSGGGDIIVKAGGGENVK